MGEGLAQAAPVASKPAPASAEPRPGAANRIANGMDLLVCNGQILKQFL